MRPHLLLNLLLLAASEPQPSQSQDETPACSRLEKETRLRPRDGSAWARLALCEQEEEHTEKARHANFLAIRWGNERTRKNAYMRLWRMQQVVQLPERQDGTRFIGGDEPPPPGCVALRAAPELECTTEVRACAYSAPGTGIKGAIGNTYVKLDPCEGPCELRLRPPELSDPEHLDAEEKRSFEGNRLRVYRYDPRPSCNEFEGQLLCGDAGDSQSCEIVSVDPCNRRVGYVCSTAEAGVPTQKVWAAEKLLESVDCPDEPPSKHAPVCDEARLERAERQARGFRRNERFECERKRLERLQRECGATFNAGQGQRLMTLLADNAFRRGDFSRCRALLQDARPSEPSRLEAWGESLGRCGGDCSAQGVPDSCQRTFEVYEMLTSVEPEPCEIAGHTSARRVWNLAKTEAVYSCLELTPASGAPKADGGTRGACFQVQLVQQRRDGSVSTRLFELPSERPPGAPAMECCKLPSWALESFNQSFTLALSNVPSRDCPEIRWWNAWLTWDGQKLY
jgi:hypothetical protein